jgi:hypothetical protein
VGIVVIDPVVTRHHDAVFHASVGVRQPVTDDAVLDAQW